MLVVTLTMGCSVAFRTRTRITVSVTSGRTSVLVRISTQDFSKKHIPLKGWKFINWNMTGVGNPDYRIVRPDWTPEIGF